MLKRLRRPGHATVVAYLALFVALGGSAAAAGYVISKNSQIGPKTVSGSAPPSGRHDNIIPGSLTGYEFKPDSIGGARINESALGKVPAASNADTLAGLGPAAFVHGAGRAARFVLDGGRSGPSMTLPGIGLTLSGDCIGRDDSAGNVVGTVAGIEFEDPGGNPYASPINGIVISPEDSQSGIWHPGEARAAYISSTSGAIGLITAQFSGVGPQNLSATVIATAKNTYRANAGDPPRCLIQVQAFVSESNPPSP